ncbi:cytochrome P450 [Xylariales sp. AK1849]|nr:cytochrome P450 [Xylariales sp. AK1849]
MAIADAISGRIDGFTISIILGGSLLVLFWRLFTLRLDGQEPPPLKPDIPVVGHIIGMICGSHGYWLKLYEKQPMPACTLPMLNGKMYIINSPELISATFKARTLSFDPYLHKTIGSMVPLSKQAKTMFAEEHFYHHWIKVIYGKMTGTDLLKMNTVVLTDIFRQVNALPRAVEVEDTYVWLRNVLTTSTISALLGTKNPWREDRSLENKYWTYDANIHHFVLGPAPRISAPAAYKARADMHQALIKYYNSHGYEADDVSAITKGTDSLQREHNWSSEDRAAMMIAIIQGSLANTIPTGYWYFMHIICKPRLVARLRDEARLLVTEGQNLPNGKREMLMDIKDLESRAPLLVAAFRENQRVVSIGTMSRMVMEDTVISDGERSYLLKKDTPLQISGLVGHSSEQHWGADVAEFEPDRFMKKSPGRGAVKEFNGDAPVKRGVFVPFGGGKHICPGRNFASAENWGTLIALLLGFDITDPEGQTLLLPARQMPLVTAGIGKPKIGSDLRSCIRRRKGWEDVVWKVAPGSSGPA